MSKNKVENNAKRLARLAAVQGLYQIALLPKPAAEVIKDFRTNPSHLLEESAEGGKVPVVDFDLFANVLGGVMENVETLDQMIAGAFDGKISADRVEILLKAILRAGAYELYHNGDIPAGVIINDYVDVAHAFFSAKEPGLVNGVMDKLAKNLRAA